jgi:hypothetical protein
LSAGANFAGQTITGNQFDEFLSGGAGGRYHPRAGRQ